MPRGRPRKHTDEQSIAAAQVSNDLIKDTFEYWKEVMQKSRAVILDTKRSRRIGWAIKNYGLDSARHAILGCSYSDWHMGKNPGNKTYNDISLIFRDAEHVEMFLERYEKYLAKSARETWIDGD